MDTAVLEADPVRVVEDVGAAQAVDKRVAVRELQRSDFGCDVFRARTPGVIGQRLDAALLGQKTPRDEAAREAERAGDDVEPGWLVLHQNGKRVRSYAADPGRTCPLMTTRGR